MWNALRFASVFLVFVGMAHGGERVDRAVLGLPTPRDPGRPGAVMLHGGGRFTEGAFRRFVALAGGKDARIVLVPSAGYRRANYDDRKQFDAAMRRRFSSWFDLASRGQIQSFEILTTDDPDDADDAVFVRPLTRATGVWFGGGEQARLNYRYVGNFPRRTLVQAALRDVVARGGVVGGTSAGMAAMPEVMALRQERRETDGPLGIVPGHGLGAIVEQHFDGRGGRLERFTGLLRDSPQLDRFAGRRGAGARMVGLAVEGSTALVLQGDRLEALGVGKAHVFLKSSDDRTVVWHALQPGERATLRRDPGGVPELLLGR